MKITRKKRSNKSAKKNRGHKTDRKGVVTDQEAKEEVMKIRGVIGDSKGLGVLIMVVEKGHKNKLMRLVKRSLILVKNSRTENLSSA